MELMDQERYDEGDQEMEIEESIEDVVCVTSNAQSNGRHPTATRAHGMDDVDDEECPLPLFENGRYRSPWGPCPRTKMMDTFKKFLWSKNDSKVPKKAELDKTLPVIKPDLSQFDSSPVSGVRHLWIGHSTSLVQFDGIAILTDPMFSDRCSPVQLVGHKRFRPTPCPISELPHIDIVLISHTHYDHLDYGSVLSLNQRYGNSLQWYVPQGLLRWMQECGCMRVTEMTWWQEEIHSEDTDVKVVCTPCHHWSKRMTGDENKVLWCSWCVIGPKHNFFFAGDTAYCNGFKQIGKRYGPFTLSTIPIGAYSPRSTMANSHVDPENAVNIHIDVRSEASIGIHWGTFSVANEPYLEPKQLLEAEVEKRKMKPSSFFTVNHGEITLIGCDGYNELD